MSTSMLLRSRLCPCHRPRHTHDPLCRDNRRRNLQEHGQRHELDSNECRPDECQRLCSCDLVYALAIDPSTPSTLYAGTFGGGIFKSTDSGTNWTAMNAGLTNVNVYALAISSMPLPSTQAHLRPSMQGHSAEESSRARTAARTGQQ